ncbi:MAG: DUF6691 family protein [Cyclobacteriaceae bacterium]
MKKYVSFFAVGIFFGIVLTKAEIISWYRIQEMFLFDSFHMYGVIGSAVVLGIIGTAIIKKKQLKSIQGKTISFTPKKQSIPRYLFGGVLFGLGWAMVGACPGPIYTLIGYGYSVIIVVLLGSVAGTWAYGLLRSKLPH